MRRVSATLRENGLFHFVWLFLYEAGGGGLPFYCVVFQVSLVADALICFFCEWGECILPTLSPVRLHSLVHFPERTDEQTKLWIIQYSYPIIKALLLVWGFTACVPVTWYRDSKLDKTSNMMTCIKLLETVMGVLDYFVEFFGPD